MSSPAQARAVQQAVEQVLNVMHPLDADAQRKVHQVVGVHFGFSDSPPRPSEPARKSAASPKPDTEPLYADTALARMQRKPFMAI